MVTVAFRFVYILTIEGVTAFIRFHGNLISNEDLLVFPYMEHFSMYGYRQK